LTKERQPITSATRQVRQQWFSVCIFPLGLLFGLIPIHRDNPPLRVASYVCVLNQPAKAERMLYKRWKPFVGDKTKAGAERTGKGISINQQRDWPSADDLQG
jgi:hypothetical protein